MCQTQWEKHPCSLCFRESWRWGRAAGLVGSRPGHLAPSRLHLKQAGPLILSEGGEPAGPGIQSLSVLLFGNLMTHSFRLCPPWHSTSTRINSEGPLTGKAAKILSLLNLSKEKAQACISLLLLFHLAGTSLSAWGILIDWADKEAGLARWTQPSWLIAGLGQYLNQAAALPGRPEANCKADSPKGKKMTFFFPQMLHGQVSRPLGFPKSFYLHVSSRLPPHLGFQNALLLNYLTLHFGHLFFLICLPSSPHSLL